MDSQNSQLIQNVIALKTE